MKFIVLTLNIFILTFIHQKISATTSSESYSCNKTENEICSFTNISINFVTFANYYFVSDEDPSAIHTLQIRESTVQSLSKNVCYHFSNLLFMIGKGIFLEYVPTTAFQSCLAIKKIDLSQNQIQTISDGTFAGLKHLTSLNLHNNALKFFEPTVIQGSTGITHLALVSNHLLDLDEVTLVKYLPALKTIYLNDNEFSCDRVATIKGGFLNKSVQISRNFMLEKTREFEMVEVDDLKCIPHGTWTKRFMDEVIRESMTKIENDEALPSMIRQSLTNYASKMNDVQVDLGKNFTMFESKAIKEMTSTFDIINETITRSSMSYNDNFHALNTHITTLTKANNVFLLKIDGFERKNAAMQLLLDTTQHTLQQYIVIVHGIIVSIIILLILCLTYAMYCNCRRRRRCPRRTHTPSDTTPPKHQLSLATMNVCRL